MSFLGRRALKAWYLDLLGIQFPLEVCTPRVQMSGAHRDGPATNLLSVVDPSYRTRTLGERYAHELKAR